MLRPVKPVEPATFQELYEVSDANFYKVLRHTPLIIVGPLTGQEDNQSFPWVMSREDGEPVFGSFDHSFEIAPGRTREELFLGMIDYTVKCMGREKLEVKVAKTPEEMRDMVAERWPGTEIGELVEDWVTLIDKIAAAAKRTRRGDFTRRRTGLPVEDIEAALKAALDRPIEKEASCECEGRGCACCEMGKEAFDAKIEATIKKFGHMVMGVRATEPGDGPDMFYTVGLAESGLP
jgi:hypothetical protein